jgi:NodT family efflux transporter outer membrane factor (OMF) lipoprotein
MNSQHNKYSPYNIHGELSSNGCVRRCPLKKYASNTVNTAVISTLIALAVIILMLSGCSLHRPLATEDSIRLPVTYSTGTAETAEAGKWWEQFGDDDLNSLVEESFRNNPDIAQAYARLMESEAILNKAGAARGIGITINATGGRAQPNGLVGSAETYTLSSAAQYEIDLRGKLKALSEAAARDLEASRENVRAMFVTVASRVADLYFLAAEQQAQLDITDSTINTYRDLLKRIEARYYSGLVPAIDVYQARQSLAAAEARRGRYRSGLAVTVNALAVLAGRFDKDGLLPGRTELPEGPFLKEGIPSQLLETRPDVKAALSRLRAADSRIAVAVADRFPSFTFSASYGGTDDRVRTVLDDPNIFWNILLQAAQSVIDSGLRKAEVDRTRAVYMERLAAYHATVLKAYSEVEDALAKIEATTDRIRSLEELADASDDALRVTMNRYLMGVTDYQSVLIEQTINYNTKSELLAARRQLISDRISLARALGGQWADEATDKYLSEKGKLNE